MITLQAKNHAEHIPIKDFIGLVEFLTQNSDEWGRAIDDGDLLQKTGLSLTRCHITELPESFGYLTQLTLLDLRHNRLSFLPTTIGNLSFARTILIHNNPNLSNLPLRMTNLSNLIHKQL